MIAFVLSGGGNRGALEAGALQALFEAGIKPDMLVGSSAGALNAAYLAANPTLDGANQLADVWRHARQQDLFPGNALTMLARFAAGKSLFTSDALRSFMESHLPPDKRHFGDLQNIRLYVTGSNLNTGQLYLYGEDPTASIVDAVVISASHPLAFPPVNYEGYQMVDGGVIANVPVGIAVDQGATEVYVLNVGYSGETIPDREHLVQIITRVISVMMYQHLLMDLKAVSKLTGVTIHYVELGGMKTGPLWDLSQEAEMVQIGKQKTQAYLAHPTYLGNLSFEPVQREIGAPPDVPPGARPYTPSLMR